MGSYSEFFAQAEDCKRWAERAKTVERKARWLDLATKWLKLAEGEAVEPEPEPFKPVVYEGGAKRSGSD